MPIFSKITKYQAHVHHPSRMAEQMSKAFDVAAYERGPVQVRLPSGVGDDGMRRCEGGVAPKKYSLSLSLCVCVCVVVVLIGLRLIRFILPPISTYRSTFRVITFTTTTTRPTFRSPTCRSAATAAPPRSTRPSAPLPARSVRCSLLAAAW